MGSSQLHKETLDTPSSVRHMATESEESATDLQDSYTKNVLEAIRLIRLLFKASGSGYMN